jgi:hypothetical protein
MMSAQEIILPSSTVEILSQTHSYRLRTGYVLAASNLPLMKTVAWSWHLGEFVL